MRIVIECNPLDRTQSRVMAVRLDQMASLKCVPVCEFNLLACQLYQAISDISGQRQFCENVFLCFEASRTAVGCCQIDEPERGEKRSKLSAITMKMTTRLASSVSIRRH